MVSRFLEESRAFLKMPCSPGNKVTCLEKIKQLVISIPLAAWYSDISVVKEGQMMELSLSLKVLIETGGKRFNINSDLKTGSNVSAFRTSRDST